MDQLRSMRLFRAVVDHGSLVAAAEVLHISTPMASKYLAALEAHLGARLIHRSSRQRSLTEAGRQYYEQCRSALDLIDAAEAQLREGTFEPSGELKVSMPVWCANAAFAELLAGHRRTFPKVTLDLHLDNRQVDLVADGYDAALRVTFKPSPSLLARPICEVEFVPVIASGALGGRQAPLRPQDLSLLGAVVPNYMSLDGKYMVRDTEREAFSLSPCLRTDSTALSRQAVLAGLGMAILPLPLVMDDLASGHLLRLLPQWHVPPITLYAVYASRRQMAPKLRGFIDLLVERLPRLPGFSPIPANRSRSPGM